MHINHTVGRVGTIISLVALLLLGFGPIASSTPVHAQASDFALGINFPGTGNLVRGGVPSCPPLECTSTLTPLYLVGSFTCFYSLNNLSFVSLNDFEGPVTLELLNLPAGVTSQTAATVNVPRGGAATTPFRLDAATGATLGAATVTLRATAGSIVHTLALNIAVADALPPIACDNPPLVTITSPAGQSTVSGVVTVAADATDSGTINNGIAEVRFSVVNGPVLGIDTTAPYAVNWDTTTVGDGLYEVRASAVDLGGNISSGIANVTVANGVGGDTVNINRTEYDAGKDELRVDATSTNVGAILQAFVTSSNQLIGTLDNKGGGNFEGRLSWPVNPQNITVRSSAGGSASANVTLK